MLGRSIIGLSCFSYLSSQLIHSQCICKPIRGHGNRGFRGEALPVGQLPRGRAGHRNSARFVRKSARIVVVGTMYQQNGCLNFVDMHKWGHPIVNIVPANNGPFLTLKAEWGQAAVVCATASYAGSKQIGMATRRLAVIKAP